jgi:hypothetical protein
MTIKAVPVLKGFLDIEPLVERYIEQPNRDLCLSFLKDNAERFDRAWGSTHNHQAWAGGYRDHITDMMNAAIFLYNSMSAIGALPFWLSDVMVVLFLHDIEKMWKGEPDVSLKSKEEKKRFRDDKIFEYGFELSPDQDNALEYVEGEGDDYTNKRRVMNELAAFCHMCDVASARIWHSKPLARDAEP